MTLLILPFCAIFLTSCASNEAKAKKLLEEFLKGQGVKELVVDIFYTSPNFPDKAYTSATVTYNFASAQGRPQRDFMGFILTRVDNDWRIERNTSYTKDPKQAETLLGGGK